MIISNLLIAASSVVATPQNSPNIVVFLVDDMGLMDTSVPFLTNSEGLPVRHPLNYWYRTPNMQRLADQGICFSNFYAQSVSSPSRASLMTGQNAARHRTTNWINAESNNRDTYGPMEWNWQGLSQDTPTMPKVLQQAGYKTIHIGKAHFGCNNSEAEDSLHIGFDVNIGGSAIGHPGSYYGEWGYGHIKGQKERAVPDLEKYHGTDTFLSDALTQEAVLQVNQAIKEQKPFYLNMAHYAVHQPFQIDKRFIAHYKNSDPQPSDWACGFATLIEGMDKALGDLMDELERLGIAENTLIIFLGDNGGDAPFCEGRGHGSSAPLRGRKGTEFEGGMRVPFIAAWAKPDKNNPFQKRLPIKQGAMQLQLGRIMDIYPTVLSIAGCEVPENYTIDGFNLTQQFKGKRNSKRPETFLMHFPHEHRGSYFTIYREGDWKVIYYYNPETPDRPQSLLFNLKDDPEERHECSAQHRERHREMLQKMIDRLDAEGALYPIDKQGNELRPRMII